MIETTIDYYTTVAGLVDAESRDGEWKMGAEDIWGSFFPPAYAPQSQGWKIHLSCVPRDAECLIARVIPLLIRSRSAFKIAKDITTHEMLVSSRVDRSAGGKFMTVYPASLEDFRDLIEDLYLATKDYAGPGILSDLKYRDSEVVYYRYGGFQANLVLVPEGSLQYSLISPSGSITKDERKPWFSAPSWAALPFKLPEAPRIPTEDNRAKEVFLAGRFKVDQAIRHSYRGGVYRALDTQTGRRVIVKQARPHTGADRTGNDSRDWLRHEAESLRILASNHRVPKLVDEFEYQGDFFLAMELIEGVTLRAWAAEYEDSHGHPRPLPEIAKLFTAILESLEQIHAAGYIFRDFNPGNIMVNLEGLPVFIDLEFLARPGEKVRQIHTPGYSAPEIMEAQSYSEVPGPEIDIYGFGMSLFRVATGIEPAYLPDDGEKRRSAGERNTIFMDSVREHPLVSSPFEPIVCSATRMNPAERAKLPLLKKLLKELVINDDSVKEIRSVSGVKLSTVTPWATDSATMNQLLGDGISHLHETASWGDQHVWPPLQADGLVSDPMNVQSGSGGVLVFLNSLLDSEAPILFKDSATELARSLATWITDHFSNDYRVLPGLYFGRTGTALALAEAAKRSGNEEQLDVAIQASLRAPSDWFSPDITHGIAGLGLASLRMYQLTGLDSFKHRVEHIASKLASTAIISGEDVKWVTSDVGDSRLGGVSHFGFAHGIAGICYFLERASFLNLCSDYSEIVQKSRLALLRSAIWKEDAAYWPTGDPGAEDIGLTWWCSGSVGVGLYLASSDAPSTDEMAACKGAAKAAWSQRWNQAPTACHGLASAGQYLLDLGEYFQEPIFDTWATDVAGAIASRAGYRNGKLIIPGDDLSRPDYGYNTGMAGALSFINRLQYGGSMPLMAPTDKATSQNHGS